jgi:hypothetical protein
MSYTTVDSVAGEFTTFARNSAKGPSDTQIQTRIDDVAAEIDAVLLRRFQEAISAPPANGSFSSWVSAFTTDQLNLLEKMNRLGASGALARIFQSLGLGNMVTIAKDNQVDFAQMLLKLNARDEQGKPSPQGGDYDVLFDPLAKVETPRAQMGGVAGGDQYPGQTASENDSSFFKKWDRRES